MIYDKLTNIGNYLGIHPNLDTAIHYILSHSLEELPLGPTAIDADNVYVNVMEASASPAAMQRYEIHMCHMDIQIDLLGIEGIQIGDSGKTSTEAYNKDTDFAFAESSDMVTCTMGPGNFIICMPKEPHKPGIAITEDTHLKKCVIKIKI